MTEITGCYIPGYCHPDNFLPPLVSIEQLFSRPPYLFQDFVGKALAFLKAKEVQSMGFSPDMNNALPCKWKCADESLFGVDLVLYAYTARYPFDKGSLGGFFNPQSVSAAVHHAPINLDFGGAHVGYMPGEGSGKFGRIPRPQNNSELSPDCGYLSSTLSPFVDLYRDACENIFLHHHKDKLVLSIPNEFLHPAWSTNPVRLTVDLENLVQDDSWSISKLKKFTSAGRSVFFASSKFTDSLPAKTRSRIHDQKKLPIGKLLTSEFFHIFDVRHESKDASDQTSRIMPYMSRILTDPLAPPELMAAVIHSNLEHNRLSDTIRNPKYSSFSFASFTGVFIDVHDLVTGGYLNLFQPIAVSIKPKGSTREIEISMEEFHEKLSVLDPVSSSLPLEQVLGYKRPAHVLEQFTFTPA